MSYRVVLKRRAEKELAKLDKKTQSLIAHWILSNLEGCEDPRTVIGAKKLQGLDDGWRWRVGTYRILGTINDEHIIIEVFRIAHRKEVYQNLR